jgi:hypothetical protein
MPGETGRISWGVYYVAYIFMDSRSEGEPTTAAGQDDACPQGAPDACDFNCNALCMLLVAAACSGGLDKALLVIRVIRRLGVKVMDCLSAQYCRRL